MAKHIAPPRRTTGQLCAWLQACRPYRTGEKAGGWFLLQTYRPDGTRGKEAGMVFFGKHGGPPGRGEKRLGWFFLVNMAARRGGGCAPAEQSVCETR